MKIEQEFINFIDDEFADTPLPLIRGDCESARTVMSYHSDDAYSGDEFTDVLSVTETDEGRLSRSLQSWMPEHVIRTLEPREKPSPEPLFSGKLGKERPVIRNNSHYSRAKPQNNKGAKQRAKTAPLKRADSEESLVTNLSLLTCSSGSHSVLELEPVRDKRRKRRKRVSHASMVSNGDVPFFSKWVELCNKQTGGALKSFMRTHNVLTAGSGGYIIDDDDGFGEESEAFRLFDKDEQDGLFQTGRRTGIKFIDKEKLKRSSSMSTIKVDTPKPKTTLPRVLSASATKARGKPIDLSDLKRERMNKLIAIEQAKYQEKEKHSRRRKTSLGRRASARSMTDSSTTGRPVSPPTTIAPSISAKTHSVHSSDLRPNTPEEPEEERITVWKGDREILEIDLKRELTGRVKQRIATTRSALTRVSGLGDSNEKKTIVGIHDEFPKHTEDDFCHRPRIIQKMRISPQLSGVIHDDIQVRMGRPRYHEIRVADLIQWNKGQTLNKAHTNLKVFNWLHSLRESEFRNKVTEDIEDEVPDEDNLRGVDFLHVEAADEPEVKPLYRAYEVRLL